MFCVWILFAINAGTRVSRPRTGYNANVKEKHQRILYSNRWCFVVWKSNGDDGGRNRIGYNYSEPVRLSGARLEASIIS